MKSYTYEKDYKRPTYLLAYRVDKFRVFRYVKNFMEVYQRSPTSSEVETALGLSEGRSVPMMQELRSADGLPFPIPAWAYVQGAKMNFHSSGGVLSDAPMLDPHSAYVDDLMAEGE